MEKQKRPPEEIVVQGLSASQGIAYGQVFVYVQSDVEVPNYVVVPEKRIDEVARFDQALLVTRQQIAKIQDEVEKSLGKNEAPASADDGIHPGGERIGAQHRPGDV